MTTIPKRRSTSAMYVERESVIIQDYWNTHDCIMVIKILLICFFNILFVNIGFVRIVFQTVKLPENHMLVNSVRKGSLSSLHLPDIRKVSTVCSIRFLILGFILKNNKFLQLLGHSAAIFARKCSQRAEALLATNDSIRRRETKWEKTPN